jgi:hypothetical protein
MDEDVARRMLEVLEGIRANQQVQLERQAEAMELQKRQYEHVQSYNAGALKGARRAMTIIPPLIVIVLLLIIWLLFRMRIF